MPWIPEQFSAPALARALERKAPAGQPVAYYAGLLAGDPGALAGSFAGEPELHDPIRGRVRGARALEAFAGRQAQWFDDHQITVQSVNLIVTQARTIEEVELTLTIDTRKVNLPVAIVADRQPDGHLLELRIYHSTWPLSGSHAIRPPLLQPDPDVYEADVVGDYQRGLAKGDIEATVAAFDPDATVREPAGAQYTHHGHQAIRELFTLFFSNGGGIPLEHCTATDDGQACALEYNVVAWGRTAMPPEAGIGVYVRGTSGLLTAARIYDDSDPPLHQP